MNRKTMLLLFAALTLLVSSLTATDGRMIALGNPFGFIRDNTDISAFPGAINRYNRNVVAELNSPGSSYYWTLGANLPVMNNVLGVYLNTQTNVSVDNAFGNTYPHYNMGDLDISKKIQFYLGFLEQFGVGFGMAIDSQKEDNSDNPNQYVEQAATYFDVSGGMSTDMMDFGAKLMIAGAGTEADVDTETSLVGAVGLETSGRYYIMDTDQFSLMGVANLTFSAETAEAEFEHTDAQNNVSLTTFTKESGAFMFDIGVGANYKIAENHTVIVGFKPLRMASRSEKNSVEGETGSENEKLTYTYIPEYNLALESQIAPWLVGRVGAMQNYCFYTDTNDPEGGSNDPTGNVIDEDSWYDSHFNMNLGLGFKFGNFGIDTVLSKSLLHDGPHFIGGVSNGLATHVSVDFKF